MADTNINALFDEQRAVFKKTELCFSIFAGILTAAYILELVKS